MTIATLTKSALKDLAKILASIVMSAVKMLNAEQKIMKLIASAFQTLSAMQKFNVASREQPFVRQTLVESMQCAELIQMVQLVATVHHCTPTEIQKLNVNHLQTFSIIFLQPTFRLLPSKKDFSNFFTKNYFY